MVANDIHNVNNIKISNELCPKCCVLRRFCCDARMACVAVRLYSVCLNRYKVHALYSECVRLCIHCLRSKSTHMIKYNRKFQRLDMNNTITAHVVGFRTQMWSRNFWFWFIMWVKYTHLSKFWLFHFALNDFGNSCKLLLFWLLQCLSLVKYWKTERLGNVCIRYVYAMLYIEQTIYSENNPTAHKTSVDFSR